MLGTAPAALDLTDVVDGTSLVLAEPWVLTFLAVGAAASLLAGPRLGAVLARRRAARGRSAPGVRTALTLALLGLTVILALTLPIDGAIVIEAPRANARWFLSEFLDPAAYQRYREWAFGSGEGVANIALYVPFAFGLAYATRRFLLVAAAGVALSVAVETVQSMSYRAATVNDVINNGLGTLIGVALAAGTAFAVALPRLVRRRAARLT